MDTERVVDQRLSNHQNSQVSQNVHKFVAKLRKYRIVQKDILSFLGFNYKAASLILNCTSCSGNHYSKNQIKRILIHTKSCSKKLRN